MKPIFSAIGRFLAISTSAFGIATAANFTNHKGYWEGTIFRVQTTDFNMLATTLPTKLSYALMQGKDEEIQRTLNSNYGLFGMVVTDCTVIDQQCPKQQILYSTESSLSWKQTLTDESLPNHPYSLLYNPPPVLAEQGYENSRDLTWDATGQTNPGQIIGRVYYVRGIPPEFGSMYQKWLQALPGSLLSDSGSQKYYALTLSVFFLGGLSSWGFIEWLLHRKRMQKVMAQREKEQLLKDLQQLRKQLRKSLHQINVLIAERQRSAHDLTGYQKTESQRIQELEQLIAELENQLASQQANRIKHTQLLEQSYTTLKLEVERREQVIAGLKGQISNQQQGHTGNAAAIAQLQQQLQAMTQQQSQEQARLRQYQGDIHTLRKELERQTQEKREASNLIDILRKQLLASEQKVADANQQQAELQRSLVDLNKQKQADNQKLKVLEEKIDELSEEQDDPTLNEFERKTLKVLRDSLPYQAQRWQVLSGFDVSQRKNLRQQTDCIVIGKACVFIIEAKKYQGLIRPEGDAKRSAWYCYKQPGSKSQSRILVKCGHKRNPYEQISAYVDSIRKKVNVPIAGGSIRVYSIVVFEKGADVSALSAEISGTYRVTTLERLTQVIQDLETDWNTRMEGQSKLTPKQIEDLLCGKPVQKAA